MERKDERINIRIRKKDKLKLMGAATRFGCKDLTEFMIKSAMEKIKGEKK